jgi:hypothetical protein
VNPNTERPVRSHPLSRRTLVVGTAWAVPAVVVATAAPAMAASATASITITGLCIGPGNTIRVRINESNLSNAAATVTINSLTVANTTINVSGLVPIVIPSNTASATIVVTVPNPGLNASALVAVAFNYSVLGIPGSVNVTTSLQLYSNGQCPF